MPVFANFKPYFLVLSRRNGVVDPRRETGLLGQVRNEQGRKRGFRGWFHNHRASGCQRGANLAGNHGQRKIPGSNGRYHAYRLLDNDDPFVFRGGRNHVAVGAFGFFGKPLDKTGSVLDFGPAFGQNFPAFKGHQPGQFFLVFQNEYKPVAEQSRPFFCGQVAVGGPCQVSRINGDPDILTAQVGHQRNFFAGGGIDYGKRGSVGRSDPFSVYIRLSFERLIRLRQIGWNVVGVHHENVIIWRMASPVANRSNPSLISSKHS